MLSLQHPHTAVTSPLYTAASLIASVPAVSSGYHQRVADAGPPQAAAQLVEQAVSQGLQRQHYQQSAQKEAVGGLQKGKKKKKAIRPC